MARVHRAEMKRRSSHELSGLSGHPSAIDERPAIYEHTEWLDNLVFAELVDLVCVKTKPFAQNFICVLSKQRRRLDFWRAPAETHRPARHFEWTDRRMFHRLHDAALLEVCVFSQLHRVEDGACGHAGAAEHAHRLAFVVLARPGGDH